MTLPDHHLDDPVPAHHGDPFAEQRAMARTAAVVDRSHRGVIAITGPDRLDWLHLLITQHVSALPDGGATEALVLDGQGRVLHHMAVAQVDDVVYLDVEAAELAELLAYLQKMVFWSKVEPRDATAELAVLSLVGPEAQAVLAALDVPVPEGAAPLEGGGYVRRTRGPGLVDLVVPRAAKAQWWQRITGAGARPAGTVAYEALRVAAVLPRRASTPTTAPSRTRSAGSAPPCTCRRAATAARRRSRGSPTWARRRAGWCSCTSTRATSACPSPASRSRWRIARWAGSARSCSTTSSGPWRWRW